MHTPVRASCRIRRVGAVLVAATLAGALSACYVVPIDPYTGQPATAVPPPREAPPPASASFTARLYPTNDRARGYGIVVGTVTNDLHGRGVFSANILGEQYTGEATRKAGSSRDGVANGAGNRGGYLSCQYTMNSPTFGSGQCRLHDGAEFSMHVGN